MLDLRRLRLLREVHARGTLHAAATALGYTTSAVSQQLAVLEREARVPLLQRVGRNVRLTAAGEVLVAHAGALLEGMEAAEADLAAVAAGQLAGVVRVAAFQSAFLHLVIPAVEALGRSHPDIRVEATEAEVEDSAPALRLQHLDLVVGDEYDGQPRPLHPGLQREGLLREAIHLVLPAGHPEAAAPRVSLARVGDLRWAACQPGTGHHQMHLRLTRHLGGFEPDTRFAADDFLILLELVRSLGVAALLPELTLRHAPAGIASRPIGERDVWRDIFLLTRQSRAPAVEAVCEAIRAAAREPRTAQPAGVTEPGS